MSNIDNINMAIIDRVKELILKGYTRKEIKYKLANGEITSVKMPKLIASQYIDEALSLLNDTNYIKDLGLYSLYRGAIEKKDYKTALQILKELGTNQSDITIKIVK